MKAKAQLTRKEYENWLKRLHQYYEFLGIEPFGATFEKQQKRKIDKYHQALETLDIKYLFDKLFYASICHIRGIGFSLMFEPPKPSDSDIDTPFTVVGDVREFKEGELDEAIENFENSLPEWIIEFLEDIDCFIAEYGLDVGYFNNEQDATKFLQILSERNNKC